MSLTVALPISLAVASLLSVTFNSKLYIPCTRPVTDVAAKAALVIVPAAGPEIFVHIYPVMVPVALPERVTAFVGSVMVLPTPALATGGGYRPVSTETCLLSLLEPP